MRIKNWDMYLTYLFDLQSHPTFNIQHSTSSYSTEYNIRVSLLPNAYMIPLFRWLKRLTTLTISYSAVLAISHHLIHWISIPKSCSVKSTPKVGSYCQRPYMSTSRIFQSTRSSNIILSYSHPMASTLSSAQKRGKAEDESGGRQRISMERDS